MSTMFCAVSVKARLASSLIRCESALEALIRQPVDLSTPLSIGKDLALPSPASERRLEKHACLSKYTNLIVLGTVVAKG